MDINEIASRLTAYADGELSGEEAAKVEAFIAENPEARSRRGST